MCRKGCEEVFPSRERDLIPVLLAASGVFAVIAICMILMRTRLTNTLKNLESTNETEEGEDDANDQSVLLAIARDNPPTAMLHNESASGAPLATVPDLVEEEENEDEMPVATVFPDSV